MEDSDYDSDYFELRQPDQISTSSKKKPMGNLTNPKVAPKPTQLEQIQKLHPSPHNNGPSAGQDNSLWWKLWPLPVGKSSL